MKLSSVLAFAAMTVAAFAAQETHAEEAVTYIHARHALPGERVKTLKAPTHVVTPAEAHEMWKAAMQFDGSVDSIEDADSAESAESADSAEGTDSADSADSAEGTDSADSVEDTNGTDTIEDADSVDSTGSVEYTLSDEDASSLSNDVPIAHKKQKHQRVIGDGEAGVTIADEADGSDNGWMFWNPWANIDDSSSISDGSSDEVSGETKKKKSHGHHAKQLEGSDEVDSGSWWIDELTGSTWGEEDEVKIHKKRHSQNKKHIDPARTYAGMEFDNENEDESSLESSGSVDEFGEDILTAGVSVFKKMENLIKQQAEKTSNLVMTTQEAKESSPLELFGHNAVLLVAAVAGVVVGIVGVIIAVVSLRRHQEQPFGTSVLASELPDPEAGVTDEDIDAELEVADEASVAEEESDADVPAVVLSTTHRDEEEGMFTNA